MADIGYTTIYRSNPQTGLKVRVVKADSVDQSDTLTIHELTIVKDTVGVQMDSGAAITATETGTSNVVTVTSVITDKPVVLLITGY